jgi:hypothetical protein
MKVVHLDLGAEDVALEGPLLLGGVLGGHLLLREVLGLVNDPRRGFQDRKVPERIQLAQFVCGRSLSSAPGTGKCDSYSSLHRDLRSR